MSRSAFHTVINILIALVWLINGLFCKVFNMAPRHLAIVARILGEEFAWVLTKSIGVLEVLMAFWIVSGIQQRFCAITQAVIILSMNVLEFFLAPDLLLFGRFNLLYAVLFSSLILANEFLLKPKKPNQ